MPRKHKPENTGEQREAPLTDNGRKKRKASSAAPNRPQAPRREPTREEVAFAASAARSQLEMPMRPEIAGQLDEYGAWQVKSPHSDGGVFLASLRHAFATTSHPFLSSSLGHLGNATAKDGQVDTTPPTS